MLCTRVPNNSDPGYGSTAKMLGQAAACLALYLGSRTDATGAAAAGPAEQGGGFWMPASLFGDQLVERLRAHAGVALEALDGP